MSRIDPVLRLVTRMDNNLRGIDFATLIRDWMAGGCCRLSDCAVSDFLSPMQKFGWPAATGDLSAAPLSGEHPACQTNERPSELTLPASVSSFFAKPGAASFQSETGEGRLDFSEGRRGSSGITGGCLAGR
jgi:hypothetical protein